MDRQRSLDGARWSPDGVRWSQTTDGMGGGTPTYSTLSPDTALTT